MDRDEKQSLLIQILRLGNSRVGATTVRDKFEVHINRMLSHSIPRLICFYTIPLKLYMFKDASMALSTKLGETGAIVKMFAFYSFAQRPLELGISFFLYRKLTSVS